MSSYHDINNAIQGKIHILKDEPNLTEQTATILLHYKEKTVQKTMEKIISENPNYEITYHVETNCVTVLIKRK